MSSIPSTRPPPRPHLAADRRRAVTEALRRAIRRVEDGGSAPAPHLPLDAAGIDRVLPGGGLRLGCIHEVTGDEGATGFCAALLACAANAASATRSASARISAPDNASHNRDAPRPPAGRSGALLWISRGSDLYAPGLVRYGIEAGRLLVVSGLSRDEDMLWAMEEALRCPAVTGVVAETGPVPLAAARRLMLAAEGTGVLGLALSRDDGLHRHRAPGVHSAFSRWNVTTAPGRSADDRDRWRVKLLHCRGGRPTEWLVPAAPALRRAG